MPDIGLLELILIGIVAFLVLGPERMPELVSQVGDTIRHARRWMGEIRHQFHQETEGLRSEVSEVRDALSEGISTMPDERSPKKSGQGDAADTTDDQTADRK
ncbi:MAG: Sec-independent protein translocase protein TatB [Mariprofundaceae bacterium]|nr:Sec-independent protein translocase protein TatB [Mariprofundaceae bacterium]